MTKKKLIGIISGAVVFVALLIVATFYDLKINIALGDADSVYGQFFRLFGELTGWIIVPIAGAFMYQVTPKKNKGGIVVSVLWAVVVFVGWFLSIKYILEEFTGAAYTDGLYLSPYSHVVIYAVVFSLLLTPAILAGTGRIGKEKLYKLAMFAAALLVALAISQVCVNIMKILWSRQRFRNLPIGNGGTDSTGFTPWYKPNFGKNKKSAEYYYPDSAGMKQSDAYKSFPSGHTAGAALTFVLIMLPDLFEKLKKFKPLFFVFALAYTVAVAVSRIVNRAHYMSDTLFGGYIGALSSFVAIAIVKKFSAWGNKKFSRLIPAASTQEGTVEAPCCAPSEAETTEEKADEE